MPIYEAAYHRDNFNLTQSLGEKLNAGDATFSPEGYEGIYLLVKQFPHPSVSGGQEIEIPMAGGSSHYGQTPYDPKFTGQITFLEVTGGAVKAFAQQVLADGGFFDARIYEGTPDRHIRSYRLQQCFFKLDPSDRDWENRTQVLQLSGTLYGHYFGQEFPGNV